MGDRELQTAAVQVVALGRALEVTQMVLNAAHIFIDVVSGDESESVLSEQDADLAAKVHEGIIAQGETVEQLGEDLLEALQTIAGMTDDEIAVVQQIAADEGTDALPTASDDDWGGQYL